MPDLTHEEELAASRPPGAGTKDLQKPPDGREEPYEEEPEAPTTRSTTKVATARGVEASQRRSNPFLQDWVSLLVGPGTLKN
jgi:hypothetical protein